MNWKMAVLAAVLAVGHPEWARSDALTRMVQADLITLGYDPGRASGEVTTKTIIAVSKFQAEHNLEATGEITPQLAGVIKAAITKKNDPASTAQPASATASRAAPAQDQAALRASQQACLEQKAAAARQANATKQGLGKLFSAISRSASQFGAPAVASQISSTTSDIYSVDATAADLKGAAKDLGLSESDVEACRNP